MPELAWPRQDGPLTLAPPTAADLDQVLTWRNSPEVTRWLLLTAVDPETYTRNWLADDPDSIAVTAHVDRRLVGTGSLSIGGAMGQVHAGRDIWSRAQGRGASGSPSLGRLPGECLHDLRKHRRR